jgi:hypothetical protein
MAHSFMAEPFAIWSVMDCSEFADIDAEAASGAMALIWSVAVFSLIVQHSEFRELARNTNLLPTHFPFALNNQ